AEGAAGQSGHRRCGLRLLREESAAGEGHRCGGAGASDVQIVEGKSVVKGWCRGSLLLVGLAFLVPRPAHGQEAAQVTCKDGTKSKAGQGACSGHGGVDKSASKSAAEPEKSKSTSASASSAAAPGAAETAEVTCKDGTTSHGGKGACSGHGGVDKSAS